MMRLRQKRSADVRLKVADVPTAVERVTEYRKAYLIDHRMGIRVTEDGGIIVRIRYGGRYYSPPYLKGSLVNVTGAVELQGTVFESRSELIFPWMFGLLALFMAAIAIGILISGDFANPGIYVCGASAIFFAPLAFLLGRQRHANFTRDAEYLIEQVRLHLLPD